MLESFRYFKYGPSAVNVRFYFGSCIIQYWLTASKAATTCGILTFLVKSSKGLVESIVIAMIAILAKNL